MEEWLHFVAIDPIQESSIGICLNTLSHSEEEGVWKKENQKSQQGNKKENDVLTVKVSNIAIIQSHSNLFIVGIVQEGEKNVAMIVRRSFA